MKKIKNALMILPLLFLSTHSNAFETNANISQLRNLDEASIKDSNIYQKNGKVYKKHYNEYECELKKPIKNKEIEDENKKLFLTLKKEFNNIKNAHFTSASDINKKISIFLQNNNKIIENAFCKSVYSSKIKEQKEMVVFVYKKAIEANSIFIENLENKKNKDFTKSKLFDKVYKSAIFKYSQQMDFLLENLN